MNGMNSSSRFGLRPTRRDFILFALTLCLSYLLFSPSNQPPRTYDYSLQGIETSRVKSSDITFGGSSNSEFNEYPESSYEDENSRILSEDDYEGGSSSRGGGGGLAGLSKFAKEQSSKYIPDWLWPSSSSSSTSKSSSSAVNIKNCPKYDEESFTDSLRTYGTHGDNHHISGLYSSSSSSDSEDYIGNSDLETDGFDDDSNYSNKVANSANKAMEDEEEQESNWRAAAAAAGFGDDEGDLKPISKEEGRLKTKLLGHQAGWTLMERAYVFNGSVYVVTEDRGEWPDLIRMTSTGLKAIGEDPNDAANRRPKGHEIMFISPAEAAALWGPRVYKMSGTTWLWNDGGFVDHYYHFAAELLLGTWRVHASMAPDISPTGETTLPAPKRAWFLHQSADTWRDYPKMNPLVMWAAFPSISFLYPQDWADLAKISTQTHNKAYMFETLLYADRSAAFYGPYTASTSRTVAAALWVGECSRWWWEPIRRQILRYSGVKEEIINRNLEGFGAVDPVHYDMSLTEEDYKWSHPIGKNTIGTDFVNADGDRKSTMDLEPVKAKGNYKPVVVYVSRQNAGKRKLTEESHEHLVRALERKREELDWELHVVEMEKLTQEEQIALAGKATILLGVHGNGLTHLLWMAPTPRSAVIEMYYKGGFARDYQWTAHALGMRHFGVQHDKSFTAPDIPEVDYPEGFQGNEITVDGLFVANLIEDRLAGRI